MLILDWEKRGMLYVMLLPGTSLAADALSGWFRQYMTITGFPAAA